MKLGIQLYSVRDVLKDDFLGTLRSLSAMSGFQGLEFAFIYGDLGPMELADLIETFNWEVSGLYDNFNKFIDPENEIYSYAEALKSKYFVSGFSKRDLADDIGKCVEKLEKACSVAASKGMSVCYHAHPHDYEDRNGKCYMDALLEVKEVKLEPDTAWIMHGGKDVMRFLEQNADRIPMIHLKDSKADNTITELGNGVIDLLKVVDFAAANNVEWLNYEQDDSETTSLQSSAISLDYLKRICQRILIVK